jgi:hypothetical protein
MRIGVPRSWLCVDIPGVPNELLRDHKRGERDSGDGEKSDDQFESAHDATASRAWYEKSTGASAP